MKVPYFCRVCYSTSLVTNKCSWYDCFVISVFKTSSCVVTIKFIIVSLYVSCDLNPCYPVYWCCNRYLLQTELLYPNRLQLGGKLCVPQSLTLRGVHFAPTVSLWFSLLLLAINIEYFLIQL